MCNCVSLFRNRGAAIAASVLLVASLALGGCHSRKTVISAKPGYSVSAGTPSKIAASSGENLPAATSKLMAEADKWLGTPYRYGGSTRGKGADCSGFVTQVFSDALAIKLPRSSAQQQQWCSVLRRDKTDLVPGDLVFFSTGKGSGVSHVGLYVGNGKMIHSSTSKGVIVTDLNERYYAQTYHSAGRVEPYYAMIENKRKGNDREPDKKRNERPSISLENLAAASSSSAPEPADKQSALTEATAKTTIATVPAATITVEKNSGNTTTPNKVLLKTVSQQPDTALSADEARRRLLLRLETETDSIR